MAKVISVNISTEKGVVKQPINRGYFKADYGLEGDAHAGNWHRQVSLLDMESILKMQELGMKEIKAGVFAENITTQGIVLYQLPLGSRIKIGEVILEITQIGKECHLGCEIRQLVGDCIMPREGVFAKVIKGGWIEDGVGILKLG